jgi:hypothetical protein
MRQRAANGGVDQFRQTPFDMPGMRPFVEIWASDSIAATAHIIVKPIGYLIGWGFALWFAISLTRRVALDDWLSRVAGAVVGAVVVLVLITARLA